MSRREFEMTEDDLRVLKEASQPVPYLVVGGTEPISPQARANEAWAALGRRMGFDHMTVRPVPGEPDQRRFTAEGSARDDVAEYRRAQQRGSARDGG